MILADEKSPQGGLRAIAQKRVLFPRVINRLNPVREAAVSEGYRRMPVEKLRNNFAGRVLGAGLAGLTALTPLAATAQDATPVVATPDCGTMNEELCELHIAGQDAHEFASTNPNGVGIVFHIGEDLQAVAAQNAETYGVTPRDIIDQGIIPHYQDQLQSMFDAHGLTVQVYGSVNQGAAGSGFNFYIGESVFVTLTGDANIPLPSVTEDTVAAVAESLEIDRRIQEARNDTDELSSIIPVANPPG